MDWIQELTKDPNLNKTFTNFLQQYGLSGLGQALSMYKSIQLKYICKTKTTISKISIADIYYLEIQEHNISIHTQHGVYQKYGTLSKELQFLSPYGFIKCNQSCIVSLEKIRSIYNSNITLINNTKLHMSQHYAPKLIIAFSQYNIAPKLC